MLRFIEERRGNGSWASLIDCYKNQGGNQGVKNHTHYQFFCYLLRERAKKHAHPKTIMVTFENCKLIVCVN